MHASNTSVEQIPPELEPVLKQTIINSMNQRNKSEGLAERLVSSLYKVDSKIRNLEKRFGFESEDLAPSLLDLYSVPNYLAGNDAFWNSIDINNLTKPVLLEFNRIMQLELLQSRETLEKCDAITKKLTDKIEKLEKAFGVKTDDTENLEKRVDQLQFSFAALEIEKKKTF